MAIVYAACVPHSPLFIPRIGRDQFGAFEATRSALQIVSEHLVASRADAALVISGHETTEPPYLELYLKPRFTFSYTEFGDFDTTLTLPGSLSLASTLRPLGNRFRKQWQFVTRSDEVQDYGITTALFPLFFQKPTLPVTPLLLHYPKPATEFEVGKKIRSLLLESRDRVAVIASANLSHRLTDASAPAMARGKTFDKRMIEAVLGSRPETLSRVHETTRREMLSCGLGPLLCMLGIFYGSKSAARQLSYESPFGIGLPVIEWSL